MVASVTITKRGEQRLRNGHPWIYKSDVGQGRGRRRRHGRGRRQPRPARRLRALQRPIGDRAAHVHPRPRRRPTCRCGASGSARRCAFRDVARHRRHRLPPGARRGGPAARRWSSIATATISCSRRSRRRPIGCCRRSTRAARRDCRAGRHPRAQRSAGAAARRARAAGRGPARHRARDRSRCAKGAVVYDVDLVSRPEDRAVPRSAREPRGGRAIRARPRCSMRSATTAASR